MRTYEEIERFHSEFVERHSSPARAKFMCSFGDKSGSVSMLDSSLGSPTSRKPVTMSLKSSPLRRLETSQQVAFLPYGDALKVHSFQVETRFRILKAPT